MENALKMPLLEDMKDNSWKYNSILINTLVTEKLKVKQ